MEAFHAYMEGRNGIINAPTGSGKTFSLWLPIVLKSITLTPQKPVKLKVLWITPVRALANDLKMAMQTACDELDSEWKVELRTGDTDVKDRDRQRKNPPQALITTPESLQLFLASKDYHLFFEGLECVVVDEWHELLGNKRGVQIELALSRIKAICPEMQIWGVSATIGNLEEAMQVILGDDLELKPSKMVRADIVKKIDIIPILPDEVEEYPWAGHLGIKLLEKIIPIIEAAKTTLIFTNTRSQAEIWYSRIMESYPEYAGLIALHHGSLSQEIRLWVEDALHKGTLKAVVCTSSLDLGVDFRPVESVIQVGGPKGVARFLQRAGRSGHRPGDVSKIYFLPTHSLELVECASLREAYNNQTMESRIPMIRCWDVLCQYMVTLSLSQGLDPEIIFKEVRSTFAYSSMSREEYNICLQFVSQGGATLEAYHEFNRLEFKDDKYFIASKRMAMRHRLQIGTIVSDASLKVKFLKGSYIGTIEEYFITRLNPGDIFVFAGRNLELVSIKDLTVLVKLSKKTAKLIPQWMGGRMSLSSQLSSIIREKITDAMNHRSTDIEMQTLIPLLDKQRQKSHLPSEDELLIEYFESKEGFHFFCFTFEGRNVNEGLGSLLAFRLGREKPLTFSISMTDYGFELLSDQDFWPVVEKLGFDNLFSAENLVADIMHGFNVNEMAKRKFRDIAVIAGLVFQGYPNKEVKQKHLMASTGNFFQMFRQYEPDHFLLRQAYEEVLQDQLEETRLRYAITRILGQTIIIEQLKEPSPFCFPIMVERFRASITSETIEDRVQKMIAQMTK